MDIELQGVKKTFYIGICFLLCTIVIELIVILHLNSGVLVYTLDDPYIHLALSENIWNGHYGINSNEFSAPSSSILWPLIISPFSRYEYAPFIINVIAAIATSFFFTKILLITFSDNNKPLKPIVVSIAVILLLLATNIIGLPFSGMEHSLQVLLVSIVAYGLIVEVEKKRVDLWLLITIAIAPLVRYECMAISVAAIMYLASCRYYKQSMAIGILLAIFVGGYSVFLKSLNLELLPTSVYAKSYVVENSGSLNSLAQNLKDSLFYQRQGLVLYIAATILAAYRFHPKTENTKRKRLATVTILAVFLHLIAGRFDWYNRYEIYILSFTLLISLYVFSPAINSMIKIKPAGYSFLILALIGISISIAGKPYISGLFSLPIAANNIYEQQFQMHRFAVDYYKKPIAVNDLGYVSYKNNNYVLDLWGLGSEKAFQNRIMNKSGDWMSDMCREYDVELAMIYEDWFNDIPEEWIKVGSLHLGKQRITPARSKVDFYATNHDALQNIIKTLHLFTKTLPSGVGFDFQEVRS